jgi:phosphohistidine phosphatase
MSKHMSSASKVYFMQHGLAVDKSENAERPLSEAGIIQSQLIAEFLKTSGTTITHIFHSGKLRASQTAEIIANGLSIKKISANTGMSPNDDVSLLRKNLTIDGALYVGHLPHLENFVSYLVTSGGQASIFPNIIHFQNSAIVCLEKNETAYDIHWYLTPELLSGKNM